MDEDLQGSEAELGVRLREDKERNEANESEMRMRNVVGFKESGVTHR